MIESWDTFSMKQIREFMVELGYPIEYTYSLDRRMCIIRIEALLKKKYSYNINNNQCIV